MSLQKKLNNKRGFKKFGVIDFATMQLEVFLICTCARFVSQQCSVDAIVFMMATEDKKPETDTKPPVVQSASASQSKVWLKKYDNHKTTDWQLFCFVIITTLNALLFIICEQSTSFFNLTSGIKCFFPSPVCTCKAKLQPEVHVSRTHQGGVIRQIQSKWRMARQLLWVSHYPLLHIFLTINISKYTEHETIIVIAYLSCWPCGKWLYSIEKEIEAGAV